MIISTIKEAAVYRNGAYIDRLAQVELQPGKQTLLIEGLTSTLSPSTVSVAVPEGLKGSNVRVENRTPDQIKEALSARNRQISLLSQQIEIRKEQIELYKSNSDFSQKKDVDIDQMSDYIASLPEKVASISEEILNMEEELTELNKKLVEETKKLKAYIVKVDIEAQEYGTYPIRISYFETNASWHPRYEIRTRDDDKITLRSKAAISQRTNEKWNGIRLRLYTGNPSSSQDIPDLQPLYLNFYQRMTAKMAKRDNALMGMAPMMMAARAAGVDEEAMEDTVAFNEIVTESAEAIENDTMMEYVLDGTYCIDDINEFNADLSEETIECRYHGIAVPKLDNTAYLAAEVKTSDIGKLIDSPADIYHQGTYLGEVYLDADINKPTYDIPLGKDASIRIKREQNKKYIPNVVLKGQKRMEYDCDISVTSAKSKPCPLTLIDQLPVSQDKTIIVDKTELSGASLDSDNGQLKWEFIIEPHETRKFKLAYSVSWPKDKDLDI